MLGIAMKYRIGPIASLLVLVAAQSVDASNGLVECRTTAGLRAGGSNDVIRVTNQSQAYNLEAYFEIVDGSGVHHGTEVIRALYPNSSVSLTAGQIFNAAELGLFNANYFIQVVQHDPNANIWDLQFQAIYKNNSSAQGLPLLFTCPPSKY